MASETKSPAKISSPAKSKSSLEAALRISVKAPAAIKLQDVKLQVVDAEGYRKVLEKHRGKVILVDFWATWCLPCLKHFPHTVELNRRFSDQGLAVISLSIDDSVEKKTVREFLAMQGATFDNLLSKFGTGTESLEAFNMRGGVPLFKLYDRQGKLRYQFGGAPEDLEGGQPIDQIDRRVEELLKEK